MPESFLEQHRRTHHTRPIMNARDIDSSQFSDFAANGVGVITGFVVSLTTPISKKIQLTRGRVVGPDAKEMRVALGPEVQGTAYTKGLSGDSALFDVEANLESLSGTYAALDPASHSILITIDTTTNRPHALKITNAERTAIEGAIGAGEAGEATGSFDAATADHRARNRASVKNPDGAAAANGEIAGVDTSVEFVVATATLDGVGGDIDVVLVRRERKQDWTAMNL